MAESSERVNGKGGDYLGEISALCFLKLPSSFSPLPFLLAGTGSQILLFDVNLGRLIRSFRVFDGVRVHGIASHSDDPDPDPKDELWFKIVVSGERRVKLFRLQLKLQQGSPCNVSVDLILLQLLPRFSHWVLDFSFLILKDDVESSQMSCRYIAVGSSDNALHIWDTLNSRFILEDVKCPERCLLYSMRFWGHTLQALVVASGTIFNQIVVWKLVYQQCIEHLSSNKKDPTLTRSSWEVHQLEGYYYEAEVVSRLSGHEGSIFCLSWSSDGSKLVSVSDDRCARMWIADAKTSSTDGSRILPGLFLAGPILFGHGARVWDCCISDSLIVTAGEDCTCRIWGLDGRELGVIKEHIGRGIWRCLYDPNSSLLVTAGFDSAIKVHFLPTSSISLGESIEVANERKAEVFKVCIPNSPGHSGLMDSKSEYVRCLRFAQKDTVYIATNHGCVYHAKFSDYGSVMWTELVRVTQEVPVICLDLLSRVPSELSLGEDWVAIGDGRGSMKIIKVQFCDGVPKVASVISWSAERERQLLGAYWCKSLGCRFVFTTNPRGLVKLWRLSPSFDAAVTNCGACLVADFKSPFGARIMSLDATFEEGILVCGDVRGNLVLFPFSSSILLDTLPQVIDETSSLTYFKGAHGISSVSSISVARFSSNVVEICSTGGDGCICYLEYIKDRKTLEFVGMRQIKELSLVQSVSADHCSSDDSTNMCYAVGFSSTDFLIWNLVSEAKVLQVKCGGWRRPHSYYLGTKPETYSSFAFVKDEIIYVHRYLVPDGEQKNFPRNLHVQLHGREIHSLCIIRGESQSALNGLNFHHPKASWIATGCEDGTVRLTRYDHDSENWDMSRLLGEHVGGSAVRSLCFVSKYYSSEAKMVEAVNGACETNDSSDNLDNPSLLISVGAKRVLTTWLLRNRPLNVGDSSACDLENNNGSFKSSLRDCAMSFKWLSTDMPVRSMHSQKKAEHLIRSLDAAPGAESVSSYMDLELTKHEDAHDNDWRYLAVTAFLVSVAESRLTVCFVVVACSDATLLLRALVLPYRYWFDVASLAPLSSPVLALQHAVTPVHFLNQGNMLTKNIYTVISGSTDGSIAFWDLTANVEAFVQRAASLHIEKVIDFQKRPRTGRGSQGGRWWKSVDSSATAKRSGACVASNNELASAENVIADRLPAPLNLSGNQTRAEGTVTASCSSGGNSNDSFPELSEIKPLHILHNVHKSGVNCLHLCGHELGNSSGYSIISGGDDQALTFLQVVVAPPPTRSIVNNTENVDRESVTTDNAIHFRSNLSCSIKILLQKKALSAHSSAVKGVWTDGFWAFSTGLDQRVRCWNHQANDSLTEYCHFITSVPEPEALDVRSCGRNCYQVVVAGRGMQIAEILVSCRKRGVIEIA